jgi:hypothetical protein
MPTGKRARELFSQPQSHCPRGLAVLKINSPVPIIVGNAWRSRSSAFAGPVDDRMTIAASGDSSKPAARLYLHQEAFGVLAANATIRHQLEPWAARLRQDQPHLLAARRARQFGHSEIRTGRSWSGGWLHRGPTHRRKHNATNMMILSASARIWTEPPRIILMVPIGSKSGRRRELQARWPTKTSPSCPKGRPTQRSFDDSGDDEEDDGKRPLARAAAKLRWPRRGRFCNEGLLQRQLGRGLNPLFANRPGEKFCAVCVWSRPALERRIVQRHSAS